MAVRDALFAAGARDRYQGLGLIGSAERSVLARAVLEQILAAAQKAPITDAELAEMTARHWRNVDRPSAAQTTHAVVRVRSPDEVAEARALADRIAAAVAGAKDSAEFIERANAVPAGELQVKAESLPPVTTDGRVVNLKEQPGAPTQRFDLDFSRAANSLANVGDQSSVTRTNFGFHIIMLTAKLEEKRLSLAERREVLTDAIVDDRARKRQEELLTELRQQFPVEVTRSADDLTSKVKIER
jgi:parvulin-like peptidyl-prolyl isomerase